MAKKYFEDIAEGEHLNCRSISISKEDIVKFATEFDPQPFHVDEEAARASVFGGLVASSLHTLSVCTRTVVEAQGDIAILSGVGMDAVKMFNPVGRETYSLSMPCGLTSRDPGASPTEDLPG